MFVLEDVKESKDDTCKNTTSKLTRTHTSNHAGTVRRDHGETGGVGQAEEAQEMLDLNAVHTANEENITITKDPIAAVSVLPKDTLPNAPKSG